MLCARRWTGEPDSGGLKMARMLRAAFGAAADAVRAAAAAEDVAARAYHTTLFGVAVDDRGVAGFAGVGDGAGVARRARDSSWIMAMPPQQGEYANSTFYITRSDWEKRFLARVYQPGAIDRVALCTDGLLNLCLDRAAERPYQGFFHGMERWQERRATVSDLERYVELRAFLRSGRVRERADDDITLLLGRVDRPERDCAAADRARQE